MYNHRYNDYYLVNDDDIEEDSMAFKNTKKKRCSVGKIICVLLIIIFILAVIAAFLTFVAFPLVFMSSVALQQLLVFTHWNLQSNKAYFEKFRFPGLKNRYITIKDIDNVTELSLGLWQILPFSEIDLAINNSQYDYDEALKNSNHSVLLYFHGTGEDRSNSNRKYQLLRLFFQVIAFDYRSYGDSSHGDMYESTVVHDCIQIYQWLRDRTDAPIYVWGHSLGTALATSTLAQLKHSGNANGLILEAPFTSLKDELYNNQVVKYFTWLPWFAATIVRPLERNGFVFNTSGHIVDIECPIMFMHARDDTVVPYFMSKKLYNVSSTRAVDDTIKNDTVLYLFDKSLNLRHYFIYQDPYVIFYIKDFLQKNMDHNYIEGSHQSYVRL